ncbi:hypothetical protein MAR_035336 [Mya arenaria]|uniref:Uncharacterized protein n=1 Tax=Mya arenaria TaxID=6604 RepID=A0ABY7EK62_MYAAR|nr:uncharacterized protein LOC128241050 [Mya arenaria]WAR10260.1 hypothetical protein MAR_035336 [Mya arenaria]
MASWALVFLVIVAAVGIESAFGLKGTIVQVPDEVNLKNKEVTLRGNGDIIIITIKNTETGSVTTIERIKNKKIQITKNNDDPTCYVSFGDVNLRFHELHFKTTFAYAIINPRGCRSLIFMTKQKTFESFTMLK